MRKLTGIVLITLMVSAIGYIFWHQEMQYWTPTPVPVNLKQVAMGDQVELSTWLKFKNEKPTFLHFYNFDCPCSRFNIDEFQSMYFRYKDSVNFLAVVQSSTPDDKLAEKFQRLMGVSIPTLVDKEGEIAMAMGIYSTPQAVIVSQQQKVFYKGNYNSARYCTSRSTKFAEMAMQDILEGKEAPRFAESFLEMPYGCLIPAYDDQPVTLKVSFR